MISVYLLKEYDDNSAFDIIDVEDNIATFLIREGIARISTTRDYIVKPMFGNSKALRNSPKIKNYGKKER